MYIELCIVEDPVEQHDAPPGAGAGAGVKATPPVNGRTAHVGQEQPTPYPYPAYPIMEDVEAEERLPGMCHGRTQRNRILY